MARSFLFLFLGVIAVAEEVGGVVGYQSVREF